MDIAIQAATDDAGRSVLAVSGAIDVQSRDQLLDEGRTTLQKGTPALVLDLRRVTFIDSTGIGALVELGHDAEDGNAELVIRNPSARVLRILELTGLSDVWSLEVESV